MTQTVPNWEIATPAPGSKGVIVGCNSSQEWLLPWWYMNFRLHNQHPVTFVNFGDMSERALRWCSERGDVASLKCGDEFIAPKEAIDKDLAAEWEKRRGKIWSLRKAWFKIPLALLQTRYEKTLWTDLDCQIISSVEPVFSDYLKDFDFAIVPEAEKEQAVYRSRGDLLPGEVIYNAGVVAYRHGSTIVSEWAAKAYTQSHQYMGCQKIVAEILSERKHPFAIMPEIYNWAMANGENRKAVVLHYWGAYQYMIPKRIDFLKRRMYVDLTIPNY